MKCFIYIASFLMPVAASAWEFTPGQPCLLTHDTGAARIELTFDPTVPLYTLTVTRETPWPEADNFGMRFDGPQARVIGTDRHRLSEDRRSLTVEDRGFGNVLDGLQFNHTTSAFSGDVRVTFSLEGAAEPVEEFRNCDASQPVS